MLQSKRQVPYVYSFEFRGFNSIPLLWKTWLAELLQLLTPVDSAVQSERREDADQIRKPRNARSLYKVLLWMVISLVTSIALGQLN